MDTNPESMRFVGVLGVLAEEFMNNVSPCWPPEVRTRVYMCFYFIRLVDGHIRAAKATVNSLRPLCN